jgi:hypothetical protein
VQQLLVHQTSPYYKAFKLQYYQAFCLYQRGFWADAVEEFNQCLAICPTDGPSVVHRDFSLDMLEQQKLAPKGKKLAWRGRRVVENA